MKKILEANVWRKGQRGYTLLFAVLLTTLVLSIGISILTIARKEIILAGSSRESQKAIFAADAALECVYYWDIIDSRIFSTTTISPSASPSPSGAPSNPIFCERSVIAIPATSPSAILSDDPNSVGSGTKGKIGTFSFSVHPPGSNTSCANVTVTKNTRELIDGAGFMLSTIIESRGYNVGYNSSAGDCSSPSPRKVERALRLVY